MILPTTKWSLARSCCSAGRAVILLLASLLLLWTTTEVVVVVDGQLDGSCQDVYFLTNSGQRLSLISDPLDNTGDDDAEVIGEFFGRNPIRDMDIDRTTGTAYAIIGNLPETNTRLVMFSLRNARRVVAAKYNGLDLVKMAINSDGEIFAQDSQSVIWRLFFNGQALRIGSPDGLFASAMAFGENDQFLLLQEGSPGVFFMWEISTVDASPVFLGKVRGLGGQSQGAQISFAMSMFYDPFTADDDNNIVITSFRQPFTRMFFTSAEKIVDGGLAEKLGRTKAVRLVTAGFVYCD